MACCRSQLGIDLFAAGMEIVKCLFNYRIDNCGHECRCRSYPTHACCARNADNGEQSQTDGDFLPKLIHVNFSLGHTRFRFGHQGLISRILSVTNTSISCFERFREELPGARSGRGAPVNHTHRTERCADQEPTSGECKPEGGPDAAESAHRILRSTSSMPALGLA